MAKQTGIPLVIQVDDDGGTARDLSNDITNCDWATPRGEQDVTGVNSKAHERLLLLSDFTVNINGVFNTAANLSHDVFKTVPTGDSTTKRTVLIGVSTTTEDKLPVECVLTDYAFTRAATGELTYAVPGMNADSTAPTWGSG